MQKLRGIDGEYDSETGKSANLDRFDRDLLFLLFIKRYYFISLKQILLACLLIQKFFFIDKMEFYQELTYI